MNNSEANINLLWLSEGEAPPGWDLGDIFTCPPIPGAIDECLITHLTGTFSAAWLIWDAVLGIPSIECITDSLKGPADVWHAGLQLGLQGQPSWIDFVSPTWMLNRDPDPTIQATAWRLSLRACLVRTEVLRQLGGPDPHYQSLNAAGLELGFRYIRQGAFVRHVPGLINNYQNNVVQSIPLADQVRFTQTGFGQVWTLWAGFRAIINRINSPTNVVRALRQSAQHPLPSKPPPYQRPTTEKKRYNLDGQVTVLIPTVNRYPYLRTLLDQLRHQTVPAFEIIIVDQSPALQRDSTIREEFIDLPLRWFTLDQAGQCSSRNLGLQKSEGDYILFLDDDDEIPPDLIEKHFLRLAEPGINISNGVAREVGAGEQPPDFQIRRISNVFPTNNTMIRKKVLHQSGLFDLAYDHGQRADHDLGMRLYLSGKLLILNPEIQVLHHHAPEGGLREHKARIDTYAASRSSICKINLPTVSDIYLAKRYYSSHQVREMLWINLFGTFSMRGPWWKQALKALISALRLPSTIWRIQQRLKQADDLLNHYPQIPHLEEPYKT